MNKLFALSALVLVAGVAAAQTKPKASKTPKTLVCAVMPTNKVDIAKATKSKMFADYKGSRYFFCCGGCPEEFAKTPAKFAKAPHIPTPKKSAK